MRAVSGLNKVVGYALSMLMLAVASLVAIPAMIRASGDTAWGSVALGQSIGAVAAVAVAFGWSMSGPATVARGSANSRLAEYRASLKVRLVLLFPVGLAAATIAAILTPERRDLAVAGALTVTLVGLTANWFFVGISRPYVFLMVETVPRVAGTVVGIVAMNRGHDALVGLLSQAGGFLASFACSLLWIRSHLLASGAVDAPTQPILHLFRSRGHGLVASLSAAGYVAAPLMLISAAAPMSQPMYALVDKVQRQISVALGPAVTVLQGWVPRAVNPAHRARQALAAGAGAAVLLGMVVTAVGRPLVGWLGAGSLRPSGTAILLMSVFVGANFLESVVAKSILATYHRLRDVSRATICGAVIGLPLVVVGARLAGTEGALAAVVGGLVIRLVWELAVVVRLLRTQAPPEERISDTE